MSRKGSIYFKTIVHFVIFLRVNCLRHKMSQSEKVITVLNAISAVQMRQWNLANPNEKKWRLKELSGIRGGYLSIRTNISTTPWTSLIFGELKMNCRRRLDDINTLKGIIPICSSCKNIRDDKGYWDQIESYIAKHSDANFSHGICPKCAKVLYPDFNIYDD